jgi:hypothetical protein
MKAPFDPGEVVVCVRGGEALLSREYYRLTEGSKYIIKRSGCETDRNGAWVRLTGFPDDGTEGGFLADRFRRFDPPKPESVPRDEKIPVEATK